MPLLASVDSSARIDFYVQHGLVRRAPTLEQLERAERQNTQEGAGVIQRIRWFARHPLELFPTKLKRRRLRQTNAEAAKYGLAKAPPSQQELAHRTEPELPLLDRTLRWLFLLSPVRFAVQCFFNPYYALPGSGLSIPRDYLIDHVLHSPHPSAVWDLQLIHADAGGLDEFVRRLEIYARSSSLKARVYRALAQREGYYDYLRELVPKIREFDYPPTRPHCRAEFENLVIYLNYAASL